MNIGLCGSHRTGKTTLAGSISEKFKLPFVRTFTSEVFRKYGLDPAKPMDFTQRLWIQHKVLDAAEVAWSAQQGHFVTDRTPLDMAAYTLGDIQGATVVDVAEMEDYMDRCLNTTNKYFDTLVLVQPGIPLVHEEGKAALNSSYLAHLNYLILGLCNDERIICRLLRMPKNVLDIGDRSRMVIEFCSTVHKG